MSYRIRWSSPARRANEDTLPESVATAVWEFANGALAENPNRVGEQLVRELAGNWSARRGQYRVIYVIDDNQVTVTVVTCDHRRDVYREPSLTRSARVQAGRVAYRDSPLAGLE